MPLESNYAHGPEEILRWHIITNLALGVDPDSEDTVSSRVWPVHAKSEPSDPDEVITVYHTSDQSDGRSPHDGAAWEHLGFQVRIRARTHRRGYTKANSVRDALLDVTRSYWVDVTIPDPTGTGGTDYRLELVDPGPIMDLGREEGSGRYLFTINGLTTIDPLLG